MKVHARTCTQFTGFVSYGKYLVVFAPLQVALEHFQRLCRVTLASDKKSRAHILHLICPKNLQEINNT